MAKKTNTNTNASFQKTVGSKAEVWHGTAKHTSGGLTKNKLTKTPQGRIVSKAKRALGLKAYKQNPGILNAYRAAPFGA